MGELRGSDLRTVREQLGREPTVAFSVVARCPDGHPLVIRNEPTGSDGSPFPTLFWLTCPDAVKAVSRIESGGLIGVLNDRFDDDRAFADEVQRSHSECATERSLGFPDAVDYGGVGGTRTGIKCLHAHYANRIGGGDDPVGALVAGEIEPIHPPEHPGRVAAIDLGTNSIRLLVVEPRDGGAGPRELARDMVITRVGRGVDATGRIGDGSLAGTVRVLERYCRRARALHVERIRLTATSAVRDASNRDELAAAVLANTGSQMRVIGGEEEAKLSFLGATSGLSAPAPRLVLDIGGGSTEFAFGGDAPTASSSTQMGSGRLTERHIRADPPSSDDLEAVRSEIRGVLAEVEKEIRVADIATFIPVGGTATTMQALALGLERYDPELIDRTTLAIADAEIVMERLASMTNAERAALAVMAPGRADVIVAGAAILVEVMRRWGLAEALVSETDILDGLAAELLGSR